LLILEKEDNNMTNKFKLSSITLAMTLACQANYSLAAESPESDEKIEKIVVTGSLTGKAVAKEEASFAISSFSEDDMAKIAPKSTADLFKAVPGVWAESSGGVSGANVFVRGFPGAGDAPYLTVQLQGAPIFPPPTLSFLENSTLFRIDDTVEFMEALRGGTNPVLSNGQPGLTTNFLLREGSEDTEGSINYSTSDYGLQRVDGVVSGQISDDLYFMMGGYFKSSPGARDAGFNAEKGKQLTINITKELDNGKVNLYTRSTDDHGTWYVPAPITVEGVDNEFTQIGTNNRLQEIEFGEGESKVFDFGKGRGWDGTVSGGSIDLTLDNGWFLVDRFSYTNGDADTYGLLPQGGAVKLSTVADNGVSATGLATGTVYDGDTDVQMVGGWVVLKEIEAFTNDFILTKTFDKGSVTGGFYNSTYSSKDWWSLGNQSYHVVEQGGENLTGIDCNDNADHCSWSYDINSIGEGKTTALYLAGSFEFSDALTLDAGVRRENHEIEYTLDVGLDGTLDQVHSFDETSTSWTVGANWMFADKQGIFVRTSDGSKMPFFDDLREGKVDPQNVEQYELGYKHSSDNFELYATGFFNEVTGDKFSSRPGAPIQVTTTEAYGVELDFSFFTDNGFSVTVGATLQQTEQTESSTPENIGNEAARLPNWQVRITPSYDFELDSGLYGTLYGTISSAADRFSDNANTDALILESFAKIDVGVIVNLTDEVRMQLAVNNLTDEEGLTEGDPRGTSGLLDNGRYILPRSIDFNVSYLF